MDNIDRRIEYINEYMNGDNAASSSKFDPNANVETKNIATLSIELNKFDNILTNRKLVMNEIENLFDKDLAQEYERQINSHEIYIHDETSLMPYCVSVNMYPLLKDGLTTIGGESKAPKNLNSFCGTFINFVFAVSSQFAGAVATVEFLMYFDYFARKEFGEDYHELLNEVIYKTKQKELTVKDSIEQFFQQVVYSINQPAAARGYQAVFWNISIFDKNYFDSMFGNFYFPDGTQPEFGSLSVLQELFMNWFNEERKRAVLTFPVVTMAMLTSDGEVEDKQSAEFCAEQLQNGNSFFIYLSDSADSLASCCRLRNEVSDNTFSFSLGAGGVATGSINVITMNINRLVQKNISISETVEKIHKYHYAYKNLIKKYKDNGLLPVYDAGFISLDKQFCTIGINGMVEAAEFNNIKIGDNEEYYQYVESILKPIYNSNKEAKEKYKMMFNTEFVPAENLGVKNAKWDLDDGLVVKRDTYNSYFYIVEEEFVNPLEKFRLHGERSVKFLDGGSALHLNLDEHLSKEQYLKMLNIAASNGCNYWTVNVKNTICNTCGHISKHTLENCPSCNSQNIDYATRVIGYLKRVSSFSNPRQIEENKRTYHR